MRQLRDVDDEPDRPSRRTPGRHVAPSPRAPWEARYVRRLLSSDLLVGLGAGALAFEVRFGQTVTRGWRVARAW